VHVDPAQAPGRARLAFDVTAEDTARALGSGEVEVLATPRLLAWCEAATCAAAVGLVPDGATSVGSRVTLTHLGPTPVGGHVVVTADVVSRDGRRIQFRVAASDRHGALVATGEITRIVVDAVRFTGRIPPP
jgi:fluoroacetyl-CoA thioesterase